MLIKEAKKIIVSLSKPEKMPGLCLRAASLGMQNRRQVGQGPGLGVLWLLRYEGQLYKISRYTGISI